MFGMKSKPKPNRRFYIAIACVLVIVFVASSAMLFGSPEGSKVSIAMNQSICESSGGVWNECGSPCMGAPQGTVCIQVCRQQCEWYSARASLIQTDPVFNSQPGFRCSVQDNDISICWMAA